MLRNSYLVLVLASVILLFAPQAWAAESPAMGHAGHTAAPPASPAIQAPPAASTAPSTGHEHGVPAASGAPSAEHDHGMMGGMSESPPMMAGDFMKMMMTHMRSLGRTSMLSMVGPMGMMDKMKMMEEKPKSDMKCDMMGKKEEQHEGGMMGPMGKMGMTEKEREGGMMPMMHSGAMGGHEGREAHGMMDLARLNLSPEQKEAVRQLAFENLSKMQALMSERGKLRLQAAYFLGAQQIDATQVKPLYARLGEINFELLMAGRAYEDGLSRILTSEQKAMLSAPAGPEAYGHQH